MRHTRRVKKANKTAEWVEKAGPAAARSRWRVEMAPIPAVSLGYGGKRCQTPAVNI